MTDETLRHGADATQSTSGTAEPAVADDDALHDDGASDVEADAVEDSAGDAATASVEADLDALQRSLQEYENRYLRLAADFENFKRHKAQETQERARYASEEPARALLPVLDNLRRAVEHAPEAGAEDFFVNGLHLVVREFETALERIGVTPVAALGEPFDPAVHEAVQGEESDDVDRDTVTAELVRGYRLHDRLIRPAMVRVTHPRRTPSDGH